MRIPQSLLRRAARAARLAMLSSAAVAGAASAAQLPAAVEPDQGIEARLLAVRQALAKQNPSAQPAAGIEEGESASRIAQWQNGSGWRNSGWRNS
jgi:type II secretory pathway component PulJ